MSERPQPGEILTSSRGLKVGDVVMVARQVPDKNTGKMFWWKTFRVVEAPPRRPWRTVSLLTLKMVIDEHKDLWNVELPGGGLPQIVTFLSEDQHPQGVIAMRMKLILSGRLKLESDT